MESAQPDFLYQPCMVPNDPAYFPSAAGLQRTSGMWFLEVRWREGSRAEGPMNVLMCCRHAADMHMLVLPHANE